MIKISVMFLFCFIINCFSQLHFDENFDNGSLDSAYFSESCWNINYATTLHFRVRGCSSQNPVFRIWVNPNWSWHFRASHRMAWKYNSAASFGYIDTAWVSGNYYYFRNFNSFTSDTVFISYLIPFTYSDMVNYYSSIQFNQWVRNASNIGNSVLGRNIYCYEITNPAFSDTIKKKIVLTSRQHGYESLGQHVSIGMSDYLLNSTDSIANWLRNNCIFYFYPMINPDGVYLGLNTDTYSGYNPNRFWYNGDTVTASSPCKETNVVRQDIWQRTGNRVYFSFDMHSNAGSLIYYYCGLKTAPEPYRTMAFDIVRNIRISDSLINNGNMLMPYEMACDTYLSSNWYADFWHWNNKQSVAFTLETATVPPQTLQRIKNNGIAIARGIYLVLKNQITSNQNTESILPVRFQLYQNYPNPFNPETKIKFDIEKASFVSIKIYDIIGREVRSLVKQNLSPGKYSTNFDATNLPCGVYFYKIKVRQAGSSTVNFSDTKKMVLVK